MAIANFTPLPTLPTPPNTQTDTKPIFLQKADAFNPALKGWADNFNSGTVPTLNDLIALLNQQLPYINTVADSDKAIRAIYADLSSIISVSEGIDSVQTVAEQISGVKDIADNLTEVLAAKGYAEDAKKWALIAESVANIGPATPEKIGLVKPDAVTTHITEDGTITTKDVAIGGDLGDLASARGQIGNSKIQGSHDFSSGMLSEKPGMYTAMNFGSTNVPFTGPFAEMILGTPTYRGSLLITSGRPSFPRAAISAIDMGEGGGFSGYTRLITEQQIGDGLTNTNGIISVPEYDGATASTAGTSGLVPPAAAGQHESFLTGGGEYKPALTKISDSVSLEDSKTAASAKAVKTAYDLANSKLPISGGTITGGLTINGGFESHQNINLTSDEANGLAIALYNTSNAILSSLRFKNNLITVEKGVFSADGVYSRGNMQLRTDDSNGLAIALYDLDGVSLYNSVRLKKDGTVSLEFQPLDISQGGTGARDAATARTNLFVPARPQNEEGPGQFTAIGVSAAQFTLPSGGSWAYSAIATDSSRHVSVIRSGVDAGGSTIYFGSNIAALFGFCWRWQ